jgi:transposase
MSPALTELVEPMQQETLRLFKLEIQRTRALSDSKEPRPIGYGALTREVLTREMQDWQGFRNRRQVGSITGLCPGVSASGNYRREGSVTKRGRRRVRTALIELAWRLTRFQPDYQPVKEFHQRCRASSSKAVRKKAIVALARKIAIDWWRMATGICTAKDLKLRMTQ